jgi:hypothetical protein
LDAWDSYAVADTRVYIRPAKEKRDFSDFQGISDRSSGFRFFFGLTPALASIITSNVALLNGVSRGLFVKPIGEDRAGDLRILRFHLTSSLRRSPVLQLLFDVSKEPPGQGNCVLATLLARLGTRSFLMFFHVPVGGCQDPSICTAAIGRFSVARFRRKKGPASPASGRA